MGHISSNGRGAVNDEFVRVLQRDAIFSWWKRPCASMKWQVMLTVA